MHRFYIVGFKDPQYISLFKQMGLEHTDVLEDADVSVFTGGSDVTPSYYGHEKHTHTWCDPIRDEYESEIWGEIAGMRIPSVGICRGGQFLNVMNGGTMYQHVSNHTRNHIIYTEKDEEILVTSTHHQMMKPTGVAEVLAFATEKGFREYWLPSRQGFVKEEISDHDYEVVYYPHTQSLCFQPHPEFRGEKYTDMKNYFTGLLSDYLGLDVRSPQQWN